MNERMENKYSFSIVFVLVIILFFSGFIFMAAPARGSIVNLNAEIESIVPTPSISFFESQTYLSSILLNGTKAANAKVYINGSSTGIIYNSNTEWQKSISLRLGSNPLEILAKDLNGKSSQAINLIVTRTNKGDFNGDLAIDDLDLAQLVANWGTAWPTGDLTGDGKIDDLDLAYLACHWGLQ